MDRDVVSGRLETAIADLAEAQAVYGFWLSQARELGLVPPAGSTWNNAIQQFVPDDHEVVGDGAGGFRIQPRSATASSGSQVRP